MSSENEIFTISRIHWLCDDIKFSENLVSKIYHEQILRYGFAHKQIQALEFTQYLEKCLWPNFQVNSFKCEREFIISICAIVNEKISEKVNPWDSFISKHESFESFFQRVLELILETGAQSSKRWLEQIVLIQFLNNCFLSMTEVELIFNEIKYLMSLGMWSSLSSGRLNEELTKNREYKHKYGKLLKSDDRVKFKRTFLPSLLGIFLSIVEDESVDDVLALRFAENCVVLLINLESMLVSRRYFNAIIDDKRVVVRLQNAVLLKKHEDTRLFTQLVDMLDLYAHFEIDEVTGSTLTDSELECRHREKLVKLQQQAFVKFKEPMQELWLSTCRALETGDTLRGLLTNQSRDDLQLLATAMGLVDSEYSKEHLLDMFCYAYKRRCSTLNRLNNLPLYPTERLIYDENQIPEGQFSLEDNFAIPKLSVQYLSFHDYLMRNFELFRLEASYEIKQDIERCLGMMRPVMGDNGEVLFQGWSRMAIAIDNFEIVEVGKPEIGRGYPRVVKADVSVVLGSGKDVVRAEWDGMARHDPCFLITVVPQLSINDTARYNNKETMAAQMRSLTVRGCEIEGLVDKEGKVITEEDRRHKVQSMEGQGRTWRVRLDPCQYQHDVIDDNSETKDLYGTFNILMRRRPKENNFKAVLETIRDLMNDHCVVPNWLQDLLLGYDQPCNAHYSAMTATYIRSQNWSDTFLSLDHVIDSFPQYRIVANDALPPYKITFPDPTVDSALRPITMHTPSNQPITTQETPNQPITAHETPNQPITTQETPNQPITTPETPNQPITKPALLVNSYRTPIKLAQRYTDPSRWTQFPRLPTTPVSVQGNQIRFTATQVEAIRSGMQHGLTVVVGPPGTGKTDIAVQIISNLYHNYPNQRTLIVTHSNQALNQLFEKIMHLDIDERHLLRLGHGEEALETSKDFSKYGRVNYVLAKRLQLLREVERLSLCLGCITAVSVSDQPLYTCETAQHFLLAEIMPRWMTFLAEYTAPNNVANTFPFMDFFIPKQFQSDISRAQLFPGLDHEHDLDTAKACFKHLLDMFVQLDDFRSFELMRNGLSRANSLLVQHAKIIAMTCTHAALRRRDLIQLGFSYDNILIEEAAQILEIETFIPLLLQKPDQSNLNRLKRWVMIGDHNQLPPVIKNTVFQNYCNMSQSMFARLVKLGVPAVQLNAQGRSRTDIVSLYGWRYKSLADLPIIEHGREYAAANPGLVFDYQLINVPDYLGHGESEPTSHFIQNLAEAEYCVAMYMYMRAIGYPADKITILTTYNGQKHLIRDVIRNRCGDTVSPPHKVTTVDRFQGQQNDYVLLSLVRTKTVGHLRDIRRLVVALSRARLGLYVFCRTSLFGQCRELQQSFGILLQRPTDLALVTGEHYSQLMKYMSGDYVKIRMADERPDQSAVSFIQDVRHMTNYVHTIYAAFKHNAMTTANNKRVLEERDHELEEETPVKMLKLAEEQNEQAGDKVNMEQNEEDTSANQLKSEEKTNEDKEVDDSANIAQGDEEADAENNQSIE